MRDVFGLGLCRTLINKSSNYLVGSGERLKKTI